MKLKLFVMKNPWKKVKKKLGNQSYDPTLLLIVDRIGEGKVFASKMKDLVEPGSSQSLSSGFDCNVIQERNFDLFM